MNLNLIFLGLLLFFLIMTALRATAAEFPTSLLTPQVLFSDFQLELDSYMDRVRPACKVFSYGPFRDRWDCQLPGSQGQTDWYFLTQNNGLAPHQYLAKLSVIARPSQLTTIIRFNSDLPLSEEQQRLLYKLKFPLFEFKNASINFSQMPITITWQNSGDGFIFQLQHLSGSFEKFLYQEYREGDFNFRRILFSINNLTQLNLLAKLHPNGTVNYFIGTNEITSMDFSFMSSMLRSGIRNFAHSLLENLMENADWPYVNVSGQGDDEEE